MGKYGTNLEGFGGFEGGVNSEDGAPLVSTSSDGETALLFGPAALREIQAGVANGDFAIPPDDSTATITSENPLPYWTFTDVNSSGAIACSVVASSNSPSGNYLYWTITAGTLTGKSAKISRYIPVASSRDSNFSVIPAAYIISALGTNAQFRLTYSYYKFDMTATSSPGSTATLTTSGTLVGTIGLSNSVPYDAAYIYIELIAETTGTVGALTGFVSEIRLTSSNQTLLVSEYSVPTVKKPAVIQQVNGVLTITPATSAAIATSTAVTGNLSTTGLMTAGNIASGVVSITPVANSTTGVAVTGLAVKTSAVTATQNDVSILVTAISGADALRTSSASAATFSGSNLTGFTVNIFRTNTTATGVWYFAIGR